MTETKLNIKSIDDTTYIKAAQVEAYYINGLGALTIKLADGQTVVFYND